MTQGFQALTEKEKETLRLLVLGYDAKSMARHLGLSIHTINERLRDARRKIAVSSSREAARQLREFECRDPEFSGDKPLRDAAAGMAVEELQAPAGAYRMVHRHGWIVGAVLMSLSLALFALSSLSGSGSTSAVPQSAASSTPIAETATVRSVRQWLALVDAGDWSGSWNATGLSFKSLNTSDTWAEVSQSVRAPLGAVVSRTLIGEENVPAPPYGYQVVKFRTSFARKAEAIETLSLSRENESWKVVGYTIE